MQNNENTVHSEEAKPTRYVPKTPFGKKMAALRAEIIAFGEPLLDIEGIRREIAERRGCDCGH